MDQSHCLKSEACMELRRDLNLSNIYDLVIFFRNMLKEMASMAEDRQIFSLVKTGVSARHDWTILKAV